jgi:hypothetical protein
MGERGQCLGGGFRLPTCEADRTRVSARIRSRFLRAIAVSSALSEVVLGALGES